MELNWVCDWVVQRNVAELELFRSSLPPFPLLLHILHLHYVLHVLLLQLHRELLPVQMLLEIQLVFMRHVLHVLFLSLEHLGVFFLLQLLFKDLSVILGLFLLFLVVGVLDLEKLLATIKVFLGEILELVGPFLEVVSEAVGLDGDLWVVAVVAVHLTHLVGGNGFGFLLKRRHAVGMCQVFVGGLVLRSVLVIITWSLEPALVEWID